MAHVECRTVYGSTPMVRVDDLVLYLVIIHAAQQD